MGWDTLRQHIAAGQKVFRDHFPDLAPSDLEAQLAALDSNNQTGFSTLSAHYVVLAGEVTVLTGEGEAVLGQWNSVRLAPGEARALEKHSGARASVLLAMPLPPKP